MPRSQDYSESPAPRKSSQPAVAEAAGGWLKLREWAPVFAIALLTAMVFAPVLQCEFLYWDDQKTISQNPSFNPVNFEKVWEYWNPEKPHMSLWVPLTYTVWGAVAAISSRRPPTPDGITLSPLLFHAVNLLIHCISAALVFAILRRLVKNKVAAFCAAAVYAFHPVMVEPVAWASGTKDLLCGCFSLAAILEYVRFRDRDVARQEAIAHYSVGVFFFILALLSKPAAVTLPLMLFAIDWLLLKRTFRQAAMWSLPWLLVSLPFAIIGAQAQPALQTKDVPYWMRPWIAGDAIAFYIGKILWPVNLVIDYGRNPYWLKDQGVLMYVTTLFTVIVLGLAYRLRKKFPELLAAMAILVIATLPVLGLVSFEFEWYSTVADHYLYLAMLGPAILAAAVMERWRLPVVYAAAGLVLGLFALRSATQISNWRDMSAMRQHVIRVNPQSPTGYHAAGYMLAQEGKYEEAINQYRGALKVRPDFGMTHYSLANALIRAGHDANEALKHYERARELLPNDADVYQNMGYALYRLKRYDEAEAAFRSAIQINPNQAGAYSNLGNLLMMSNRFFQAREAYETALYLNPSDETARLNLEKLNQRRGEGRLR